MKKLSTRELVLCGLFVALGLLLPFLTGQIPTIGSALLPMHLPVLICGLACGALPGAIVGGVLPLLRNLLFGMPPLFPTGVAMTFELAAYGCLSGLLYQKLGPGLKNLYISLLGAMLGGRAVWGVASFFCYATAGRAFGWELFAAGAFLKAVPGIVLQIVLVPVLVLALERSRVLGRKN